MPEQPPTLRDMIRDAVANSSFERLAERAVDPETGKIASRPYLNDLANGKVKRIPEPPHLRAIAAGLGVSYERVRRAAIAQWLPGTDPEVPADIDLREWARWTPEDRELIQLAVRTANARAKRQHPDSRSPHQAA